MATNRKLQQKKVDPENYREPQWVTFNYGNRLLRFETTWGLFSPKRIDSGSQLLLQHIRTDGQEKILDLGCGYGVLGLSIASLLPQAEVHLVDKDFVAVEHCQKNIAHNQLNNAQSYLSNGLSHIPKGTTFDLVVSNIPAKVGNELLTVFLQDIAHHLKPQGQVVIVCLNALRPLMKRLFLQTFNNQKKLAQNHEYSVLTAYK